jgi:8-oxo-dGTP pyrophosphatase MutT (NUDIX family)
MIDHGASLPAVPREAAAVLLTRERIAHGEAEFFLLRRHSGSSFMAKSFVFPGGVMDPEDRDHRVTAARELFEEAGILLTRSSVQADTLVDWRQRLRDGASFLELLASSGLELATDALHHFAHWVTPSFEKKRFSARFFVAELPEGQHPSFDAVETVDEVWVTPGEALMRAGELRLPPPQVRTMFDLLGAAEQGPSAVIALAAERSKHPHPIMPKATSVAGDSECFALLLPWDPEYADAPGEGIEMPSDHPLAQGPSRFMLGDSGWEQVFAPSPQL